LIAANPRIRHLRGPILDQGGKQASDKTYSQTSLGKRTRPSVSVSLDAETETVDEECRMEMQTRQTSLCSAYQMGNVVLRRFVSEMQEAPASVSFREITGRPPKDTTGDLVGYVWLADTLSGYWHILREHAVESDRGKAFGSYVLHRMARLIIPFGGNYDEVEDYRIHLGRLKKMVTQICLLGVGVLGGEPVTWMPSVLADGSGTTETGSDVSPHAVMSRLCAAVGDAGGLDTWAPEWKRERELAEKQRHTHLVRLALSLSVKCNKLTGTGRRRGMKPGVYRRANFNPHRLYKGIEQMPKAEWATLKRCLDDFLERPYLIATVQEARRQCFNRHLQWETERWEDVCMHKPNTMYSRVPVPVHPLLRNRALDPVTEHAPKTSQVD
ncbi:hypothetical protein KIPB_010921, partial [Kipferlia bialata]